MRITLASGTAAEIVRPEEVAPTRALVVIPDIMGLRPLFDEHVRGLSAATGWVVVAIEPWPGREHLTLDERLGAVGSIDDATILGDAVAAADETGCDEAVVLGFCMGGMYALKAAATGRFRQIVSFYGMIHVPEQWQSPTQADPLAAVRDAAGVRALAIIGTEDPWTPAVDVAELEAAGVEVVRYEGAEHGFVHDPERPAHRPDDAADAWRRALEFLAR
ncbi:MAG: dienelactone hydrolase family protein [Acidimicrobiia bacterium]|nr:dienelactone hydrolase family protein [Acidimicrobiia bacterium]